ncbi:hypothetical protein FRX31_031915 [Thalictrum thalictroides]|uniref:Uncharacterized protein n=1 Tax=Thalictrum thalictroides TaxID=46969 RepID=A0A7J6V1C1_THATH|nr:hypothetical protein FRX31_031915 [Thalictrum thalictroides]
MQKKTRKIKRKLIYITVGKSSIHSLNTWGTVDTRTRLKSRSGSVGPKNLFCCEFYLWVLWDCDNLESDEIHEFFSFQETCICWIACPSALDGLNLLPYSPGATFTYGMYVTIPRRNVIPIKLDDIRYTG